MLPVLLHLKEEQRLVSTEETLGNIEKGIMEEWRENVQYCVPTYIMLCIGVAVTETRARWTGHAA